MAKIHVTTTINGTETEFLARPEQTLLSALRDELGLMGSKEGCGSGDRHKLEQKHGVSLPSSPSCMI